MWQCNYRMRNVRVIIDVKDRINLPVVGRPEHGAAGAALRDHSAYVLDTIAHA
jgi:hypothetical protein